MNGSWSISYVFTQCLYFFEKLCLEVFFKGVTGDSPLRYVTGLLLFKILKITFFQIYKCSVFTYKKRWMMFDQVLTCLQTYWIVIPSQTHLTLTG